MAVEFERKRMEVAKKYPLPKVQLLGKRCLKVGEELVLKLSGAPGPAVDFASKDMISRPKAPGKEAGILVAFPGEGGPLVVPARLDGRNGRVTAVVPKGARDGTAVLLYPVWERFGDEKFLDKYDMAKVKLMPWQGFSMREEVLQGDARLCKASAKSVSADRLARWAHYSIRIGHIFIACATCPVQCPNGALKFDAEGSCYIDVNACKGQTYSVDRTQFTTTSDGRQVFVRNAEEVCWSCLNADPAHRCRRGRIRKVAYNTGVCCGNCNQHSRVLGYTFMELCPQGAISIVEGVYKVDPALCTGCMNCYTYINCHNNSDWNKTVWMKAHIDEQTAGATYLFIPRTIRVVIDEEACAGADRGLLELVTGYLATQEFILLLDAEGAEKRMPFVLGDDLKHDFAFGGISFKKELDVVIMTGGARGQGNLIGFNQGNLRFPMQTLDVRHWPYGNAMIIQSPYGKMVLTYWLLRMVPIDVPLPPP